MSIEKEKTIDHRMMYEGKLLHVYYDKVDIAGETYRREIVEHPGAAAIIPVTEDREILFVKQYRYPIKQALLEIPAGKLARGGDPGELDRQSQVGDGEHRARGRRGGTGGFGEVGLGPQRVQRLPQRIRRGPPSALLVGIVLRGREVLQGCGLVQGQVADGAEDERSPHGVGQGAEGGGGRAGVGAVDVVAQHCLE